MIVGLLVGVWVARYLGPEKYGLLSYAQSFVGLFSAITNLGLDGIVVRELVKNPEKENEFLGTAFWLKIIGALSIFIVISLVIQFTSNDKYTNIIIFIIASTTIFQAFNVFDFYFQSKVMSNYVVYANLLALLLSSILKVILVMLKFPLIYFAWVAVYESIIFAIGLVYFFHKSTKKNFFYLKVFNKRIALNLLLESLPLIISFFGVSVALQINPIILYNLIDSKSVGYYNVAQQIIGLFFFIPVILSQTFYPSLIQSKNKSYQLKTKSLGSLLMIIAISISLILFLCSKYIILTLYGSEYFSSIEMLKILSISIIFIFFASLRKKLLLIKGKTKIISYYSIFTALFTLLSSYIFIKTLGPIGSAIGYTVSWAISILVAPVIVKQYSEIRLFFQSLNLKNIKIIIRELMK